MWNDARWHMIWIHLPITATVLAVLFLLAAELTRRSWLARGGWTLLAIGALGAWFAASSGHGAEDVLGAAAAANEPAFSEAPTRVHDHEERGDLAKWVAVAAGVAGLAMFLVERRSAETLKGPRLLRVVVLLLGAAAAGLVVSAASLGGEIRHTEILRAEEPHGTPGIPAQEKPAAPR